MTNKLKQELKESARFFPRKEKEEMEERIEKVEKWIYEARYELSLYEKEEENEQ